MTAWSSTTLVTVADNYDREMGDTGAPLDSRFGRYLTQHMGEWPIEELLIDDAKQAVAVAVAAVNREAGPRVAKLIGSEGGQW